jgi:hypothetical protein
VSNQELVVKTNTVSSLLMSPDRMNNLIAFSEVMAGGRVMIPAHLHGKPADCLAIAMQATEWGMNPFTVAQKTHLVSGTLGYEAQLVIAVLQTTGAIRGRFHFEYQGEGQALQCRAGAIPGGETEIVWSEWIAFSMVKVKNSPLWTANPKQQMGYLQAKNWARLYAPGAILGVYSADELEERFIPEDQAPVPRGEVTATIEQELPPCTPENFAEKLPVWADLVMSGKKTAEQVCKLVRSKYTLTAEQSATLDDLSAVELAS